MVPFGVGTNALVGLATRIMFLKTLPVAVEISFALCMVGQIASMKSSGRSLKRVQTDFVDTSYVHWWDWSTSIEEIEDSLHVLVSQGETMYLVFRTVQLGS